MVVTCRSWIVVSGDRRITAMLDVEDFDVHRPPLLSSHLQIAYRQFRASPVATVRQVTSKQRGNDVNHSVK